MTKRYYSVEGEILGDSEAGDYMRDALGSVTGTCNPDTGNVLNTYRYKPYGSELSSSGAKPNPKFRWVGTAGYRQTSISHSASYVRARHYGQEEGRWTSVDPQWPDESRYGYSDTSPIDLFDPTGTSTCRIGRFKGSGICYIQMKPGGPEYPKRFGYFNEPVDTCKDCRCLGPEICWLDFALDWRIAGAYGYERFYGTQVPPRGNCGPFADTILDQYNDKLLPWIGGAFRGLLNPRIEPGLGFGKRYYRIHCSGQIHNYLAINRCGPQYCPGFKPKNCGTYPEFPGIEKKPGTEGKQIGGGTIKY
jgi:RHS repeat-associated protein